MKKVITTVGTSIFTNYGEDKLPHYLTLEPLEAKERVNTTYEDDIKETLEDKDFNNWISKNLDSSCAEISSILKIAEEVKEDLEIYLLATDTVLSRLAAEKIQTQKILHPIGGKKITIKPDINVIEGLQVKNADDFETKGLQNLIDCIIKITNNFSKERDYIFNITGGYKGLIPYLTLIGQLYEIPTYYLYEESDKVLLIPNLPVQFDIAKIESLSSYLSFPYLNNSPKTDIITLLEKERLIQGTLNNYKPSALGQIFLNYSNSHTEFSTTMFGSVVELKLFEHYVRNLLSGYTSVLRGVKEITLNSNKYLTESNGRNYGDLDIVIQSNTNFIAIEIKSFSQAGKKVKFLEKIDNRIAFFEDNQIKPDKFILIIYALGIRDNSIIKDTLDEVAKNFSDKNITYELKFLEIDMTKANPYQAFINQDALILKNS